MSDVIDWSKAPEGATQYVINSAGPWEKIEDGKLYYWYKGDWLKLPWRGDDSCSGLKIVKRPQPTPWSGEGLPPAGTVCEVKHDGRWYETTIIGVDPDDKSLVFKTHSDYETPYDGYTSAGQFRPIRTPKQIAADEREAAIDEMMSHSSLRARDGARQVFGELYDAGYRKQ